MTRLPAKFLSQPIAHRGLHGSYSEPAENSISAVQAAIDRGYGVEIDLQLSADRQAVVFHDKTLDRMTTETGMVMAQTATELYKLRLCKCTVDTIPTLRQILALVAGRAPLLIELKDQDGRLGPRIGPLEQDCAAALQSYRGPVAVMSFNPYSVERMAHLAPTIPRGLISEAYTPEDWPELSAETRQHLRDIADYHACKSCFISQKASDLNRPRVSELKQDGAAILCWTVKSLDAETAARKIADNITFEGYLPSLNA